MPVRSITRGIAFPFGDSGSFPAETSDVDALEQSMTTLILTATGERVMRPRLGSNVHRLVFEPENEVYQEALRAEMSGVIALGEPRVSVRDITFTVNAEEESLDAVIAYTVLATGAERDLGLSIPSEGTQE